MFIYQIGSTSTAEAATEAVKEGAEMAGVPKADSAQSVGLQQHQQERKFLIGPPPVLNVYPYRENLLKQPQRLKLLQMKRRVRLLQEALLHRSAGSLAVAQKTDIHAEVSAKKKSTISTKKELPLPSPLTGFEVNWVMDDTTLKRYLEARDWNVPKAFSLLVETVQFRRDVKPERIRPKSIMKYDTGGVVYRRGFDKRGNPIIYFRPGHYSGVSTANDEKGAISFLVYMLERACQSMRREEGVSQLLFLVDFREYSSKQQLPFAVALRFLEVLQNFFPERLSSAFLVDVPWYFMTFWNCLSPFLPKRTVQKIFFISTAEPQTLKLLFDKVSPENVERWIPGGTAVGEYDYLEYWAAESQQFEQLMKFLQEEFIQKTQEQRTNEAKLYLDARTAGFSHEAASAAAVSGAAAATAAGRVEEQTQGLQKNTGLSAAAATSAGAETLMQSGAAAAAEQQPPQLIKEGLLLLGGEEEEEGLQGAEEDEEEDEKESAELNEDEKKRHLLQHALQQAREGQPVEAIEKVAAAAAWQTGASPPPAPVHARSASTTTQYESARSTAPAAAASEAATEEDELGERKAEVR